jgi:hypothetical protein
MLECWGKTLSGYNLDIVDLTSKTNLADKLSCRPNFKAAVVAEDRWKEAKRQAKDQRSLVQEASLEEARTSAELKKKREEAICICSAQLLDPWEQWLAATMRHQLPAEVQGSLSNANGLFATVTQQVDEKGEDDLSASMLEVFKSLLCKDETVQCFCTIYNMLKKQKQELTKQKGWEAYYVRDWA